MTTPQQRTGCPMYCKWPLDLFARAIVIGFFASASLGAQTVPQATNDSGSYSADAIEIRALTSQLHPPRSSSSIFWSGAYPKPKIGIADSLAKPFASTRMEQRRNSTVRHEIVRLEVASAGDFAYEFFNFTLSYDMADTGEDVSFPGSGLRVWKKNNGYWEVVADLSNAWAQPGDNARR